MYADSTSFEDPVLAMESTAPARPFLDQGLGLWSLQDQAPGISSGMAGPREVESQLVRWYEGGLGRVAWLFHLRGPRKGQQGLPKPVVLPFPWVDGRSSRTKGRGI